jgi:hypothetical protein
MNKQILLIYTYSVVSLNFFSVRAILARTDPRQAGGALALPNPMSAPGFIIGETGLNPPSPPKPPIPPIPIPPGVVGTADFMGVIGAAVFMGVDEPPVPPPAPPPAAAAAMSPEPTLAAVFILSLSM